MKTSPKCSITQRFELRRPPNWYGQSSIKTEDQQPVRAESQYTSIKISTQQALRLEGGGNSARGGLGTA